MRCFPRLPRAIGRFLRVRDGQCRYADPGVDQDFRLSAWRPAIARHEIVLVVIRQVVLGAAPAIFFPSCPEVDRLNSPSRVERGYAPQVFRLAEQLPVIAQVLLDSPSAAALNGTAERVPSRVVAEIPDHPGSVYTHR